MRKELLLVRKLYKNTCSSLYCYWFLKCIKVAKIIKIKERISEIARVKWLSNPMMTTIGLISLCVANTDLDKLERISNFLNKISQFYLDLMMWNEDKRTNIKNLMSK